MSMNDMTWQLILDGERFSNTDFANTLRSQYRIYQATRHLGDPLPMAIDIGEQPIKPLIFTTAGEQLERMTGRLISERG